MAIRMELIRDESGQCVAREFHYVPTKWQKLGLSQTASGYGKQLNTGYMVHYDGRLRRVYAVCYSNVSSLYVLVKGQRKVLDV